MGEGLSGRGKVNWSLMGLEKEMKSNSGGKDAASILIVMFISFTTIYTAVQLTHDSGWLTINKINTIIKTIKNNFSFIK